MPSYNWPPNSFQGTVISVGLSAPVSLFSVSGSPVTTSGTLGLSLVTQSANTVFAGPASGGAATPTFRALVAADIPSLPYISSTLTSAHLFVGSAGNVATDVAVSGDLTLANTGAFTFNTVNGNVGSFGDATHVGAFTVNAKGLVTAASSTLIQIAESQVTNLVSDLAAKVATASLGNLTDAGTDGITITGGTGAVVGSVSVAQHVADATHNGYLSSTDFNTFSSTSGAAITALTGDGSASGPGSAALTLATVNSNVGSFGDATHVGAFTVNAKGLVTAASSTAITFPVTMVFGRTGAVVAMTGDYTAAQVTNAVDLTSPQTLSNKTIDNTNAITIKASAFTLEDGSDTTKKALFDLSGITTGATRTLTVPDVSGTLTLLTAGQTLSNKTIDDTNAITTKDSTFTVENVSDTTKKFMLSIATIATGTTRTWTVPDSNDTFVGLASTQTLTNKSLTSPTLTGTPVAPTASSTDNSTTIATTAFVRSTFVTPTIQTFASGSGTYTTPTSPRTPLYLSIRLVGAGGGGSGSGTSGFGAGGNGGDTTFSNLTGSGGGGATAPGGGGTGGAGINGDVNLPGQSGSSAVGITIGYGAIGGSSAFPGGTGGKAPGQGQVGGSGTSNTGGGGAGGGPAGSQNGGAGGGGGYVEKIISSPAATYSYGVGAAGTAGTAGVGGQAGGAGGSGMIIVEEYYQ